MVSPSITRTTWAWTYGNLGVSAGGSVLVNGGAAVDVGVGVAGVGGGAQAVKGKMIPSIISKSHSLSLLISCRP